jgi:hypothetical protein
MALTRPAQEANTQQHQHHRRDDRQNDANGVVTPGKRVQGHGMSPFLRAGVGLGKYKEGAAFIGTVV